MNGFLRAQIFLLTEERLKAYSRQRIAPELRAFPGAALLAHDRFGVRRREMTTILIIILILLLIGAAPAWPYSRGWGYYPSGTLGLILLIVIVVLLLRR